MSDARNQDTGVIDLEDLEYYVVLGVKKEQHEPVTIASPNVSLQDLGALLGRAAANHQLQIVQNGCALYAQHVQRTASKIIHPDG